MKNNFVIFVIGFCNMLAILTGQVIKVPIKSHVMMTKDIVIDAVKNIYDNDIDSTGSFYYSSSKYVDVDFDLGANYLIEKIIARTKSNSPDIRFIVGNPINEQVGLAYNCSNQNNSTNVYECIPKCQKDDSTRNGIISRKLLMSLLVRGNWESIYEIEVYTRKKNSESNFISANKLVLPDNCEEKSWLLTQSDLSIKPKLQKSGTKIVLEKNYIINEIDVIFQGKAPENLKIQLSNGERKPIDIEIDITKCSSSNSKFTCQVDRPKFPTRIVTIISNDVVQLFLRGKTVFYPSLDMSPSKNVKENLNLTCRIIQCDLSIHSDCSKNALKSGVQFSCSNKRLLRIGESSQSDSFVIINHGKLEKIWSNTKFNVESNTDKRMIVSMPRSYQYYGQYQCNCIVADESNTEINSKITSLTESDFLENLLFKIDVMYKIHEDDQYFKKSTDNLIILKQSSLKNSFITVKISLYSLVNGIMNVSIPMTGTDYENLVVETFATESIKAFEDNSNSWSVNIFKYQIEDAYPEFDNTGIIGSYNSKKYNLTQNFYIKFIKVIDDMVEPVVIQAITDKSISIKVIYTGIKSIKLTRSKRTCTKSENKELAQIHENKCIPYSKQATCSNSDNVSMISIFEERSIANEYSYSVIVNSTNFQSIIVNNTLILNTKDISIKMKYVDFNSDPMKPEITKVDVEIKFISKIIEDFLQCGKVVVSIDEPGKPEQKMVLQTSQIKFSVNVLNPTVYINLTLKIEGMEGLYKTVLNVIDPTTFEVGNLHIQDKTKMMLFWTGINEMANDFLVEYEVTTKTLVIPCNSSKSNVITTKKLDNQNSYEIELDLLSKKFSSKLIVIVQPVYKNGKRGQKKQVEKQSNISESTKLKIDGELLRRQRSFILIPGQSDFLCSIHSVDFTIKSPEVMNQIKNITKISNSKYQINELIPGRKYELTARVNYNFGSSDTISEVYKFETSDDISISQVKHIAQVNDHVNITCTADLGPMDQYRKTIEWLRADKSPLPEGVLSVTNPYNSESAFLIMKTALADYSGDYGCFAKPAASFGHMKITIIVNDLIVKPIKIKIDFNKTLKPISINCFSSTIGNGNLEWIDSNNLPISEKENDLFKVQNVISKEKSITSILTIKNPSFDISGTYACFKSIGEIKVSQKFTLYGEEKLFISIKESSDFIGGITKLRCQGQLAMKSQKVEWDTNSILDKSIISTFYPNSTDKSIQDIEIINNLAFNQVSCKILPAFEIDKNPKTKTHLMTFKSKITLEGPTNVTAGSNINLTCTGYPNQEATTLQLVFYKETSKNQSGNVVLSSKNQPINKIGEPIKLVLLLSNVNNSESGRYECKFETKSKSQYVISKSISLSVDANKLSILNSCSDCFKKSAHIAYNFHLSKPVFISVVGFALFYQFQ